MPADLRPVLEFGYITGWRLVSEVLPLEWRPVDFAAGEVRLAPHTTKNGEGRVFPMTRTAAAPLAGLTTAIQVEQGPNYASPESSVRSLSILSDART
jgi:integrase